jgi:hypothetical protein
MYRPVLSGMAVALLLGMSAPVQAEPPIRLDAGGVEIEDHSLPAPEAERHGPKPLSVLERWAHEQLAVTGHGESVHFIMLDASINVARLPVEHGFNATFKDQQDRKLIAHLQARLEYMAPHRATSATAEAIATVTVAQSASLDDLDAAYAKVLDLAADGFDQRMKREIRVQFGDLVVP